MTLVSSDYSRLLSEPEEQRGWPPPKGGPETLLSGSKTATGRGSLFSMRVPCDLYPALNQPCPVSRQKAGSARWPAFLSSLQLLLPPLAAPGTPYSGIFVYFLF